MGRQVQIDREQFFTPMPKGVNLQELNDLLMSQLITYNSVHKHPEYHKTLDEVFEEERAFLVSAPLLFDGCKEIDIRVSSTCLVRFDRNNYSVHCSCVGKIVQCKAYADQVVFIYNGMEVGRHRRKFTKGETAYDYQHYPILARKLGALRNEAPFIDIDLPEELKEVRQRLEQYPTGMRDFAHILSYIAVESMEAVIMACAQAIKAGSISKDAILNILLRKKDESVATRDVGIQVVGPALKHILTADCSIYNQLLKSGGQ